MYPTQTHSNWQIDKELLLYMVTPLSGLAGFWCTTQQLWAVLSNLLEPGQILAGVPTAMPTAVWAFKVLLEPKWLMDFVTVGALPPPVNDQVLIYFSELRSNCV